MPTADIGPGSPNSLRAVGPTANIAIGFDPNYRFSPGVPPNIPSATYPALVDTGASDSCIDSTLATALNLVVVDQQPISGVGGPQLVNVYAAQLVIPSLNWVISGTFHGVHLTAGGQPHVALLGRSFLRHHTLVYDGRTGVVQLSND